MGEAFAVCSTVVIRGGKIHLVVEHTLSMELLIGSETSEFMCTLRAFIISAIAKSKAAISMVLMFLILLLYWIATAAQSKPAGLKRTYGPHIVEFLFVVTIEEAIVKMLLPRPFRDSLTGTPVRIGGAEIPNIGIWRQSPVSDIEVQQI